MGKPRRLSTKPPGERRRGSEPSCVCMCVHGCTCAWVCVRVCICACVLTRVSSVPRPHILATASVSIEGGEHSAARWRGRRWL